MCLATGNTRCSSTGSHAVGDLSDEQSLAFLQRRGLSESDASQIVKVAGGRCIELVAAAESIHNGESIEGMLAQSCLARFYVVATGRRATNVQMMMMKHPCMQITARQAAASVAMAF